METHNASYPPNLKSMVDSAAQLPSGPQRDGALVEALRACRKVSALRSTRDIKIYVYQYVYQHFFCTNT